MAIKRLHSNGMFSKIVIHGSTIYSAGIVAEEWRGDIKYQTSSILSQIDALLIEAGSDKSKLLTTTCWLTDMSHFAAFNDVFMAWVDPANQPTRATVRAELADPALLVEIAFQAVQ